MIEDRALVSKVLNGDMNAFRLLIRQHERLVAHMVGKVVKSAEEREEVCQDVFLRVHEKLGEFNFQSRLSTWIATIAYRYGLNHLKKKKMLMQDLPDNDRLPDLFIEKETPDIILENQDVDNFVLRLIDQLPPRYKVVLMLYHVEGMTYPEIGEITGMPEGTVKNYLFRARHQMKEKVKVHLGKEELL
jgi:RNA polymerase sigma-70 factor (ECF subfamily)